MYTNSEGKSVDVTTLHSSHLINALAKKMNEIFNATNHEDFNKMLHEIDALKEEYYKRLNKFVEKIGEQDGE